MPEYLNGCSYQVPIGLSVQVQESGMLHMPRKFDSMFVKTHFSHVNLANFHTDYSLNEIRMFEKNLTVSNWGKALKSHFNWKFRRCYSYSSIKTWQVAHFIFSLIIHPSFPLLF